MPPKQKLSKHSHTSSERQGETSGQSSCRNPHVVLQPFMRDESYRKRYRFTALPATASMYNKADLSDVQLHLQPTDKVYYAHRVVLSAASEVFAAMLGGTWAESNQSELELHEEPDCARIFDRFLYFIYSGNIVISDEYVVPLFLLAGKYDIQSLYNECTKLIERALKVYIFGNKDNRFSSSPWSSSSDSSSSDSSDMSDLSDTGEPGPIKWMPLKQCHQYPVASTVPPPVSTSTPALPADGTTTSKSRSMVANETFSVALVLRLLENCHGSERVYRAALLNLEARVGNQVCLGNFSAIWLDLSLDVVIAILSDSRFGYPEMRLFEGAEAWLQAQPERSEFTGAVLKCIRYVLLSTPELYEVDSKPIVRSCEEVASLVHDAVRLQLFRSCCTSEDHARWSGEQFEPRAIPQF